MSGSTETLLSLKVAASMLGCSARTLRRWIAEGAVPAVAINPPGRRRHRWRVPAEALGAVLTERMRAGTEGTVDRGS